MPADRLSRLMIGHAWKPDPTAYLEERIKQSVLQKIYWETGLMAWEELLRLMADRGVAWPTPAGLSPHATDDKRDTAKLPAYQPAVSAVVMNAGISSLTLWVWNQTQEGESRCKQFSN